MATTPGSHDPLLLYEAALERLDAAWELLRTEHPAEAMYLGGLAIECLLQALAHLDGAEHDARHDLARWLDKCSPRFQNVLKHPSTRKAWNLLVADWQNTMRYWPRAQLLGYLRHKPAWRVMKGDNDQRLRAYAQRFITDVDIIHGKGQHEWKLKRSVKN